MNEDSWTAYIIRGPQGKLLALLPEVRAYLRDLPPYVFYNTYIGQGSDPHISLRASGSEAMHEGIKRELDAWKARGVTWTTQPYTEPLRWAYWIGFRLALHIETESGAPLEFLDDEALLHALHSLFDVVHPACYQEDEVKFWLRLAYAMVPKERGRKMELF